MKIKLVIICCFVLSVACCSSKANKGIALSSSEEQTQATLTQEEIMYDYVNSLDEFAQVMPKFGQDTEAEWAADTVRVMVKKIKETHLSLPENLARITQMQDYLAYGMVYFNAIIGAYNDPMLSKIALNIIPQSDETFKELSDEIIYSKGPETIVDDIKKILDSVKDKQKLDVVFAIDATGSMKDDIQKLREEWIPRLIASLPDYGDLRLGLLLYRDYGDDYRRIGSSKSG